MKRLCTICARGGSKGVPGKNIKQISGLPLIAYSIKCAQESKLFSHIAISSDCDDILSCASEHGADSLIKRPDNLASDHAAKIPVIRHCVKETEAYLNEVFDLVVDLDCTSPLRITDDIKAVVKLLENDSCSNVITGTPSRRSPYFNMVELDSENNISLSKTLKKPVIRRQDAPQCYDMNASIYGWRKEVLYEHDQLFLPNTRLHVMPEERSIDIDSPLDFMFVELLLETRNVNK